MPTTRAILSWCRTSRSRSASPAPASARWRRSRPRRRARTAGPTTPATSSATPSPTAAASSPASAASSRRPRRRAAGGASSREAAERGHALSSGEPTDPDACRAMASSSGGPRGHGRRESSVRLVACPPHPRRRRATGSAPPPSADVGARRDDRHGLLAGFLLINAGLLWFRPRRASQRIIDAANASPEAAADAGRAVADPLPGPRGPARAVGVVPAAPPGVGPLDRPGRVRAARPADALLDGVAAAGSRLRRCSCSCCARRRRHEPARADDGTWVPRLRARR